MRKHRPIHAVMLSVILAGAGCGHTPDQRAYEAVLKTNLHTMRDVIAQYHGDKGDYPASLESLVAAGYLRKVPADPFTRSNATWDVVREATPGPDGVRGIVEVHSGADGTARDGTALAKL
jgi:general secretion pathway protein G